MPMSEASAYLSVDAETLRRMASERIIPLASATRDEAFVAIPVAFPR